VAFVSSRIYAEILAGVSASLYLLAAGSIGAEAQTKPRGQSAGPGRNLITLHFSQAWDYKLDEPARLVEVGPVTDNRKNNLLTLDYANDPSDSRRKLLIMHWDGQKFAQDTSLDLRGMLVDALLVGKFRSSSSTPSPQSPFDRPGSTSPSSRPTFPRAGFPTNTGTGQTTQPGQPNPLQRTGPVLPPTQVVTTEGVYAWMKGTLTRLFAAPQDVHFSLVLHDQDIDDRLVSGAGDSAAAFEVGPNFVKESGEGAPKTGAGYFRSGAGNQQFPGAPGMMIEPDVRYMQSIWDGKYKFIVGLAKGSAAPTPTNPNATTGDRIVVYAPKFISKSKSFWQISRDEFEEDWRSDPLPGRVLDVRIGEPKNDGKLGILVLTSENKDQEGHLYFFTQDR
jgi:hypothetical protein